MHALTCRLAKGVLQSWRRRTAAEWLALAAGEAAPLARGLGRGKVGLEDATARPAYDGYGSYAGDVVSDGGGTEGGTDSAAESSQAEDAGLVGGATVLSDEQVRDIEEAVNSLCAAGGFADEATSVKTLVEHVVTMTKPGKRVAQSKVWREAVQERLRRKVHSQLAAAAVLEIPGKVQMGNEGLRRAVVHVLRQHDCRLEYSVGDCKKDLARLLELQPEELAAAVPNLSHVVREEWLGMFDAAWTLFLHDKETNEALCQACVWVSHPSRPVLCQCEKAKAEGAQYCQQHCGAEGGRPTRSYLGQWEPDTLRQTLPPAKLAAAIQEAKRRASLPSGAAVGGEGDKGFRAPRREARQAERRPRGARRPGGARAKGPRHEAIEQPPYCSGLTGQLRVFESSPAALPPCPCLLCPDRNFATFERLLEHVQADHVPEGMPGLSLQRVEEEYRKTVFAAASGFGGVAPAKAQQWRLAVASFHEALVTGQAGFPECREQPASAAGAWAGWGAEEDEVEKEARWQEEMREPPKDLHVRVVTLAGLWCELDLDVGATLAELQAEVCRENDVPIEGQRYVCGMTPVHDLRTTLRSLAERVDESGRVHVEVTLVRRLREAARALIDFQDGGGWWLRAGHEEEQATKRELLSQEDFVAAAVQANGQLLEHAAEELKGDREIVRLAVRADGRALRHAGEQLRADVETVKVAVAQTGEALQDAAPEVRANREVVMLAVRQCGRALRHADESLLCDKVVVSEALRNDGTAMSFAAESLQTDRELWVLATSEIRRPLEDAPAAVCGDKQLMLEIVRRGGEALEYVAEELQCDREIVQAAIRQSALSLGFAAEELRDDEDLVLEAVSSRGYALKWASVRLRQMPDLVATAVRQDGAALEWASQECKQSEALVLAAVQRCGTALKFADAKLQDNPAIVRAAVQQDWRALEYASRARRSDEAIVRIAIRLNDGALRLADPSVRQSVMEWLAAELRAGVRRDGGHSDQAPERGLRSEGGAPEGAQEAAAVEGGPIRQSERRQQVRHRAACAVCARYQWKVDLREVLFWQQEEQQGEQSFISDLDVVERREGDDGEVEQRVRNPRVEAQWLLSPQRYWRRWQFQTTDAAGAGGIPLEELEASAVRDPGPGGKLWLVHRKVFRMVQRARLDGRMEEVADPKQKVNVCECCHAALSGSRPRMPKQALANDLWIGKPPAQLQSLSAGARMLLPLARCVIRRYNCFSDSGTFLPAALRVKGFIGNVAAYPQADGGQLVTTLPPSASEVAESLLIAYTGSTEDLKRARLEEFAVSQDAFKAAYEYLRGRNAAYAVVQWSEEAAADLEVAPDLLGVSRIFAECLYRQDGAGEAAPVRQSGPAEATVSAGDAGAEGEGEEGREAGEYFAGFGDEDHKVDSAKQALQVQILLRKMELRAAEVQQHEEETRVSHDAMSGYVCEAGREELQKTAKQLEKAVKKLDVEKMRLELVEAEARAQQLEPPPGLQDPRPLEAKMRSTRDGQKVLVVPTGSQPVSSFDPKFWTMAFPLLFPNGDGVYGLERETPLYFDDWTALMLERDELEYAWDERGAQAGAARSSAGAAAETGSASSVQERQTAAGHRQPKDLPRWRGDRDALTCFYSLSRRRAYIRSARLFVEKPSFEQNVKELGRVTAEEMYEACEVVGKGEGLKAAMASEAVSERVKRVLRTLMICMANVVGTNAHRTTLRHVCTSYRHIFGPPLAFMTPNVADMKLVAMKLQYEDADVAEWRLLEDDDPQMPSRTEMLRRVAADPASQARVTDMMIQLFLEHILGVLPSKSRGFGDGFASAAKPGVFGQVKAYFGPLETQGRGGLHGHFSVFTADPLRAHLLDKLRRGETTPELAARLKQWRRAVIEKVASMQFDCVEEVGRQVGLETPLRPLRFTTADQQRTKMDGRMEEEDAAAMPPPQKSAKQVVDAEVVLDWRTEPARGPARRRPLVEVVAEDLSDRVLSRNPLYRRLPDYATDASGEARMVGIADEGEESRAYAQAFAEDVRQCVSLSHLHQCKNTCWKHAGGGSVGDKIRVCRFNFFREYEVVYYPRRWPNRIKCRNEACHNKKCHKMMRGPDGGQIPVHPEHCPADVPVGHVRKFLRTGKALVLPAVQPGGAAGAAVDHSAKVNTEPRYGRAGRIMVLRYHPSVGSTNPVCQAAMRCNFDVQCTDRVFVVRKRARVTGENGGPRGGGSLDDAEDWCFPAEGDVEEEDVEMDDAFDGPEEAQPVSAPAESEGGAQGEPPTARAKAAAEPQQAEAAGTAQSEDEADEFLGFARPESFEEEEALREDLAEALIEAFERKFRDATNQGHYQADYSTKANPEVGSVLSEQAIGIDRLRKASAEAAAAFGEAGGEEDEETRDRADARRTVVRLQTAENRAVLKKASEMAFQELFKHECYMSHGTWTVFCKGLVWAGFEASRLRQNKHLGKGEGDERLLEADWPQMQGDEVGAAEEAPPDLGVLHAAVCSDDEDEQAAVAKEQEVAAENEDSDEEAGAEESSGQVVGFTARSAQSQIFDWLHRGSREPLASMGVAHYAMYVHTRSQKASSVPANDFETYLFDDTHPACARRVQKLRVRECWKIPRLFGFTMPCEAADPFRNALFKSVLFRPATPSAEQADDRVTPLLHMVDIRGEFQGPWAEWYEEQRVLCDRYVALQEQERKLFTIADVDVSVPYMSSTADRTQPSASEFCAFLTVELSTNMELAASSRSGGRERTRPDASEFEVPGKHVARDGGGADEDPQDFGGGGGADAEEDEDPLQQAELGKVTQATYPVPAEDLARVALAQEMQCAATLRKYREEFYETMFAAQGEDSQRWPGEGDSERSGAGLNADYDFAQCKARQDELFDFRKTAGASDEAVGVGARVNVGDGDTEPQARLIDASELPVRAMAQRLIDEARRRQKDPVVLNEDQLDFLAVVTEKLEAVVADRSRSAAGERAAAVAPARVLLHGPGGSGKTEVVSIVRQLCAAFCGEDSYVAMAASNSAARVIGGDTVHSCLHLRKNECGFSLNFLSQNVSEGLKSRWAPVECLVIEEVSLVSPAMFGGISYRVGLARQHLGCDPNLYATREHSFGGIPIVIMLGDFMQLAPFENKVRMSLVMEPRDKWRPHALAGRKLFWEALTHVMFLRKTHRFVDRATTPPTPCPVLPDLLAYMRDPRGRAMPSRLWAAARSWRCTGAEDPRRRSRRMQRGFEMGIAWEAVARLMQLRAMRDAQAAGQTLLYVQAIDLGKRERLSQKDSRRALQVVSMTNTGRLLGMCPLFVGMRVRLTAKLSAKHGVVHDAPGTVVGFEYDERERGEALERALKAGRGKYRLKCLPQGVLVRFDGLTEDVGFGKGIVSVSPVKSDWLYKTHDEAYGKRRMKEIPVSRVQVPLAPEAVRTVQTAQGMSMDAATMFLQRPGNMSEDDWWLHVYVMISRVRTSAQILAYGLPPKELFERGPPKFLAEGLQKLEGMAGFAAELAKAARSRLGWAQRAASSSERGPETGSTEVPMATHGEEKAVVELSQQKAAAVREAAGPGADSENGDFFGGTGEEAWRAAARGRLPGSRDGAAPVIQDTPQTSRTAGQPRNGTPGGTGGRETPVVARHRAGELDARRMWDAVPLQLARGDYLAPVNDMRLEACYPGAQREAWWTSSGEARPMGIGLPNRGRNLCFANAAMQMVLRLQPFVAMLEAHRLCESVDGCAACLLQKASQELRGGYAPRHCLQFQAWVRGGRFGREFQGQGQCDAAELLFGTEQQPGLGLLHVLRHVERTVDPANDVTVPCSVADEFLWTWIRRERRRCKAQSCGLVRDALVADVGLRVPLHGTGKQNLLDLLRAHLGGKREAADNRCGEAGCEGLVERQDFLEKEPAILLVRLGRTYAAVGAIQAKKNCAEVSFPEELTCMRSGLYRLAGLIFHRGRHAGDGHYTAASWLGGDRYAMYDDETCVELVGERLQRPGGNRRCTSWRTPASGSGSSLVMDR